MTWRAGLCVVTAAVLLLPAGIPCPLQGQGAFPSRLDDYFTKVLKLTPAERRRSTAARRSPGSSTPTPPRKWRCSGRSGSPRRSRSTSPRCRTSRTSRRARASASRRRSASPPASRTSPRSRCPTTTCGICRSCKVGDCELKLSAEALARAAERGGLVEAGREGAARTARPRVALDYVNAYRKGGNSELAVYRDGDRPTFVANEFRELVNGMPELAEYLPDMRQYLLEYPKPAAATDDVVHLLAGSGVRAQADDSHQPRRHPGGARTRRSSRPSSSIRATTSGPRSKLRVLVPDPVARRRLLVRERQPQPVRRPERLRRPDHPRERCARARAGASSPRSPPRRRSSKLRVSF